MVLIIIALCLFYIYQHSFLKQQDVLQLQNFLFGHLKLPNLIFPPSFLQRRTPFVRNGWCPHCSIEIQALETKIIKINLFLISVNEDLDQKTKSYSKKPISPYNGWSVTEMKSLLCVTLETFFLIISHSLLLKRNGNSIKIKY